MQEFAPEGVEPAAQDPPAVIVKTEALEGTSSDHSASGDDPRHSPSALMDSLAGIEDAALLPA